MVLQLVLLLRLQVGLDVAFVRMPSQSSRDGEADTLQVGEREQVVILGRDALLGVVDLSFQYRQLNAEQRSTLRPLVAMQPA